MSTPDLFLAIDLEPAEPDNIHDLPDDFLFGMANCAPLLLHDTVNSERWVRTWRAFKSAEEAAEYTKTRPTVIVVPMQADTVPLAQMDGMPQA